MLLGFDLTLDVLLVLNESVGLTLLECALLCVTFLLSLEVDGIDSSVLFEVSLASELALNYLSGSFLVEVGIADSSL